jgi:hypothetical protein
VQPDFRRLLVRGFVVWTGVAITSYLLVRPLTWLLLPVLEAMIGLLQSDYFGELALRDIGGQPMIHMTCIVREPILLSPARTLVPGMRFDGGSTHAVHAILPLAILVVVLMSLPMRSARDGWRRTVRGLVAALVVLLLTTPVLLHGRVEAMLTEAALATGGTALDGTLLSHLFLFMEAGGRWLLPLLLGAIALHPAGTDRVFVPVQHAAPPRP